MASPPKIERQNQDPEKQEDSREKARHASVGRRGVQSFVEGAGLVAGMEAMDATSAGFRRLLSKKGSEAYKGSKERLQEWKKREWTFDDAEFEGYELESLKGALELTTREKFGDTAREVGKWFLGEDRVKGISHYRNKQIALRDHVVEYGLCLNMIDHHEKRDIVAALAEKKGSLDIEDATQVLVGYDFYLNEKRRSQMMLEHYEQQNQQRLTELGSIYLEEPDVFEQKEVGQYEDLSETVSTLDRLHQKIGPMADRYQRAQKTRDGWLSGKVASIAGVFGVRESMPQETMDEERTNMVATLNSSIEDLNGNFERDRAENLLESRTRLSELYGQIPSDIEYDAQLDTDVSGEIAGIMDKLRLREMVKLAELKKTYGSMEQALQHTDTEIAEDDLPEPVLQMREIQQNIDMMTSILADQLEGGIKADDRIVQFFARYTDTTDESVISQYVNELNEEATRKKTENATAYTALIQMRKNIESDEPTNEELDGYIKMVRRERNSYEQERKKLRISPEAKRAMKLQDQTRETIDAMAYHQELVDELEGPDSPLIIFEDALIELTGNPNIADEIEQERVLEAELEYAHAEAQRIKLVEQLHEQGDITDKQRVQVKGQLETIERAFEDIDELSDDQVDKLMSTLSGYGMDFGNPESMADAREAIKEGKGLGLLIIQILMAIFSSAERG